MKVEISFDDGNALDFKAINLLDEYNLKGTFYLPSLCPMLLGVPEDFWKLTTEHEVGGHTETHPQDLKLLVDEDLWAEIKNNKWQLEQSVDKPITKFCYPRGRHDTRVRDAVQKAGFTEARTTEVLQIHNKTGDPFQTPTTIHMFQRDQYNGRPWLEVAKEYFQKALDEDGFFSLWGHSKEMEKFNYWNDFEEMLKIISKHKPV